MVVVQCRVVPEPWELTEPNIDFVIHGLLSSLVLLLFDMKRKMKNIPRKQINRDDGDAEDRTKARATPLSYVPRTIFSFDTNAGVSRKVQEVCTVAKKPKKTDVCAPAGRPEEEVPGFSPETKRYLKSAGLHSARIESLLLKYLGRM